MADRIDHAARAQESLKASKSLVNFVEVSPYTLAGLVVAEGQVHATLALVEQQRIANVIALAGSRHPILRDQVATDAAADSLVEFHEHCAGGYWQLRPDVAAALGVEVRNG